MIIDILSKKISIINQEYRRLMDKAQAIELRIKDIKMEKLKAERELLEIEQALDKIETEILKDLQRNF